jgi:hypothetical protein
MVQRRIRLAAVVPDSQHREQLLREAIQEQARLEEQVGLILAVLAEAEPTEAPVKADPTVAALVVVEAEHSMVEITSKWEPVVLAVPVVLVLRELVAVQCLEPVVAALVVVAKRVHLAVLVVVLRSLPVAVAQAEQVEPFL